MLNETIRARRKAKGLSQQELAVKLNVVRQTVSKWEQGLSVPASSMLIALSEALETPVSALLGETPGEGTEAESLQAISEKLEVINLQLARQADSRRKAAHWLLIALCAAVVAGYGLLLALNSPYTRWDLTDPETAVLATLYHSFEWLFSRVAPLVLVAGGIGVFLTRKKH